MRQAILNLFVVLVILCFCGLSAAQDLRVNVMPDGINNPAADIYHAYASPGLTLTIWGNANGGTPPYNYEWDFGDGSDVVTGTIATANPRYINTTHAYTTFGSKYATLTVTDADGFSDFDQVRIDVTNDSINVRVNMAIEKGLRWLYLNNYYINSGTWQGWSAEGAYCVGAFGMEVLAFENRGHLPFNDPDEDIYAEYVKQGLDTLMSYSVRNTNGIYFSNGTRPLYETGIALMAIVGSDAPDSIAFTYSGTPLTYYEVATEIVQYLAYAQNANGGWRYTPNYYNSDNSVTQWPAIGLEAAETKWGIISPAGVKTALEGWINYSQNAGNGGFGYSSSGDGTNVGRTGAGICEMAFCDIPYSDTRFQRAISYIDSNWFQSNSVTHGNLGNLYAMYGVAKGCRIAVDGSGNPYPIKYIKGHDWQLEYNYFLTDVAQYTDGHWNGANYGCDLLDTDFGLLILLPVVFSGPVAVINGPSSVPPSMPFELDGSGSYHADPEKEIVEWLWDFDNSDGYDWDNPDAQGEIVTCPGFAVNYADMPDTFIVALRVRDNGNIFGDSIMTDVEEFRIIVDTLNHPPIADAGGPYSAKPGEAIVFDGTGSYDPDEALGDYIAGYAWDLDGDGLFDEAYTSTCANSYADTGQYEIALKVWDSQADSGIGTAQAHVYIGLYDVGLTKADITFSNPSPVPGETITITAVIHCHDNSDQLFDNVLVRFYDGDPGISINQIGSDMIIPGMLPGSAVPLDVQYIVGDTLPRIIYVSVDPRNEITEFNEANNIAHKSLPIDPSQDCIVRAEPDLIYAYYKFAIDSMDMHFYMGDFPWGVTIDDIDRTSILINDIIEPFSTSIINNHPGFDGKVLQMDVRVAKFIDSYPLLWDSVQHTYIVSGQFTEGEESFEYGCSLWMRGHVSGDANGDDKVSIEDITYIINYIYNDGRQLKPRKEVADVNSSGSINILDINYLLKFIFSNGPAPACPQTNY